ncbi:MAG: MFS transporter [Dehalococcoidia bacterium]|nr:MAG: MFS transporter [Dehalococcoidia bacterium]
MFYGWWVVFGSAGIIFLTGGTFFYGFGTLITPLTKEFGWSRASIAGAFSLRTELGGVWAPVVGYLVDRVGPRRLLLMGVFLVGTGFILLSRIQALWHLYAVAALIAIGIGATAGPVAMAAVAHWFQKRRGRALALMTVGGGSSGVMVVVLASLIAAFDWRTALLIMGLTQWAICIPLALIVRNRPQDLGLLPDGEPALPDEQQVAADERSGPRVEVAARQDEGLTMSQALRNRSFWLLASGMSLIGLGSVAVIAHQVAFLEEEMDFPPLVASVAQMAVPIVSLAGRLGFGWLADYVDKRKVLAVAYLFIVVGIVLMATVQSAWQVPLYLMFFAPGWGGSISVRPALQAEYFGLRAFGGIQGLMFFVGSVGSFTGPIFAGAIYDALDSYRLAFLILALAVLAAVPAVLMAERAQTEPANVP